MCHKSGWLATLITGSLSIDSRELEDVVKVVRLDKEVRGGGMGSEFILYVVTMSRLGITPDVTSARSAESAEVDGAARLDKVGKC